MYISASQIKAARAILGWLQDDLAKASGLAITTIRSLETGHLSPRSLKEVHRALENAGIEFLEGEGVKRRDDQITILKGSESCNRFFDDLLQTAVNKGDEIVCIIKSPNLMMESLGAATQATRLQIIDRMTDTIVSISKETGRQCEPHELKDKGFTDDEISQYWAMAFALASVQLGIEPKDS